MAAKKIGVVLALDGEKEFTKGISDANQASRALKAELNKLAIEFDGNANSMEHLSQKQELLSKQTAAYEQKVKSTKDGLANAERVQKNAAARYAELTKELEEAKKAQEALKEAGKDSTKEYKEQEKAVEAQEKALKKQSDEMTKCEAKISKWKTDITNAENELAKHNRTLRQNAAYLSEAEQASDHCATSIDKFGKAAQEATEVTSSWGEKLKTGVAAKGVSMGFDLIKDGASAAAQAVYDSMADISEASASLAASTGLTEEATERYRSVMKKIKGDNFGEDYKDIADAMSQVIQIMGELDDGTMQDVTESAITLRDTFGMDVNESIRAADVMVKTLHVDAKTAFDMIAKGAQNGLNRSGELVDNITEYGQLWGQAGFSAEEMFAILENGLDAGAYNLDKVNDYVKEFGNSLADGRIEDNLSSFSGKTQSLFQEWKNGEASTSQVFYSVINDLSEMTNQQEALTLASEVWSALGEDNAMQVLTALDDVNDGYKNVKGTMDELKEVKYDDLSSALSGFGAAVQENIVTPIAEKALPTITGLVENATGVINRIGEVLSPQKTAMDEFVESIEQANTDLETSIQNADTTMQNAELEAGKIDTLGNQLLALNGIESKSLAQKYQLKEIVSQLGETIPEIAAAYDEEAGKVALSDANIRNLISSTKELMMAQAAQNAMQEVTNQLVEAKIALSNAEMAKDAASDKKAMYEEEKQLLLDLQDEYNQYEQAMASAVDGDEVAKIEENFTNAAEVERRYVTFWDDMLNTGRATIEEYNAAMENVGIGQLGNRLVKNENDIASWNDTCEKASKEMTALENNCEAAQKQWDTYEKSVREVVEVSEKETLLLETSSSHADVNAQRMEQLAEKKMAAANAADSNADAIEKEADALDASAEAAQTAEEAAAAVQDAYDGAFQKVSEAYADIKDKMKKGLSVDFTAENFDGGIEDSIDTLLAHSEAQLTGLQNYAANLATVRDHVGQEIAPEFLSYLESLGTDGANMLAQISAAFETDDGAAQVQQWSDNYLEKLKQEDKIADQLAADKIALENGLAELGSTDAEWTELERSFEKAQQIVKESGQAINQTVTEEFRDAADAARDAGIAIPDGLADGLESGDVTIENAVEQLDAALKGSFEALAAQAEAQGIKVPENLRAGIEASGQEAVDAYAALIGLLAEKSGEANEAGQEAGSQAAGGQATGMENNTDQVATAAGDMASAGADAAADKAVEYQTAGEQSAGKYVEAFRAYQQQVVQAAGNMAKSARAALASYQNAFYNTGYNLSAGIAQGVAAGEGAVADAVRRVVRAGLDAGKKESETASPSKKFRRELGQQIGLGTAFGIKDKIGEAKKSANQMSKEVFAASTKWLKNYKKSHEVSLKDERYYWQRVALAVGAGTDGYLKALNKLTKANISSNFGVSKTTKKTTGSGKNKKTETIKKDAETYYSEVFSAAQKYAANQQIVREWSEKQELEYWKSVRKNLKKGTQAWYDATQEINDLKKDIADAQADLENALVSNAEDALEKKKILNTVSLSEELEYWQNIQAQTKQESDAWYEVQKKINDLNEDIAKDQEEALKAKAEALKEQEEAIAEAREALISGAEDALEKQKATNDVSIDFEIEYWQQIQAQVEEGTEAWYKAQNKISDAKKKIGTVSNMSSLLSAYKTYQEMSAQAEVEYWDIVRGQYTEGTEERLEADQKHFDAKKDFEKQLEDLENDYKDKVEDVNKDIKGQIDDLNKAYDDALKERTDAIANAYDIFDEFTSESADGKTLLFNIKSQVAGYEDWMQQINKLEERGVLSDELIEVLKEQGPEQTAALHALNDLTNKELAEYNAAYLRKMELSRKQAEEDTQDLKKETQEQTAALQASLEQQKATLAMEHEKDRQNLTRGLDASLKAVAQNARLIAEDQTIKLVKSIVTSATSSAAEIVAAIESDKQQAQQQAQQQVQALTQALAQAQAQQAPQQQAQQTPQQEQPQQPQTPQVVQTQQPVKQTLPFAGTVQTIEKPFADVSSQASQAASSAAQNIVQNLKPVQPSPESDAEEARKRAEAEETAAAMAAAQAAAKAAQERANKRGALKNIINAADPREKLSTKELAEKSDLYKYLYSNYKIKPTVAIYKALARELGIKTSSTPTASQRSEILKKLKEYGLRTGGRNLREGLVWMDEDLSMTGPEMIVRKSDNAILTRVKAGDDVIDAKTTANLVQWGKTSPGSCRAAFDKFRRAQEAQQTRYSDIDIGAGIAALNKLLDKGAEAERRRAAVSGGADTAKLAGMMEQMANLMSTYLPYLPNLEKRMQVNLDGKALVSAASDRISNDMALRQRRRRS